MASKAEDVNRQKRTIKKLTSYKPTDYKKATGGLSKSDSAMDRARNMAKYQPSMRAADKYMEAFGRTEEQDFYNRKPKIGNSKLKK